MQSQKDVFASNAFQNGHYPGSVFHLGTGFEAYTQLVYCLDPPKDEQLFPLLEAFCLTYKGRSDIALYFFYPQARPLVVNAFLQACELPILNDPDVPNIELSEFPADPDLMRSFMNQAGCMIC